MSRPTARTHDAAVLALSGFVLAAGLVVAGAPTASASTSVTVRVVVERVDEQGCTDTTSGSDFYGQIEIAGEKTDFGRIDGDDTIEPNWTAEKVVDADAASSVPVVIRIGEFDTFLNFGDDACDVSRNDGTDLDLVVGLIPCSVTGDATGACATSLFTGGSGGGQGDADLNFRVEVDPPAAAPGLNVRCTHSPLWPKPGDNVTITVESLEGTVQVGDTQSDESNLPTSPPPPLVDRKKLADSLQIWVGDRSGPDIDTANKSTTSFVVNNVAAGDLLYGCRVRAGADTVFTGWRRTRVGAPAEGKAVPVLYLGARTSRIDIVLVADMDSYSGGAGDATFLSDASDVIKGAYFGQDRFLANQQNINFWLADQTGDADRVPAPTPADPSATDCVLTLPGNWATDYSWRDSGAILHRDRFRDCAGDRVFSTEPTSLGTVLHETGHAPFGLADEYCCDGGYFEDGLNMFDTLAECQADAVTLGRVASDCRKITDPRPTPAKDWFLSEPTPNDLMNADRHPPQAADIRQIDSFVTRCRAGSC